MYKYSQHPLPACNSGNIKWYKENYNEFFCPTEIGPFMSVNILISSCMPGTVLGAGCMDTKKHSHCLHRFCDLMLDLRNDQPFGVKKMIPQNI
jgi:hypothetical protein